MAQLRTISNSSLKLSSLVLGKWHINELTHAKLEELINAALDVGITSFDHADIYGGYTCETIFGGWMKENAGMRDKIQLVSKCGIKLIADERPTHRIKHYDTSKEHIISSAEQSLKNLQTDYLDLLLIHRPDPLMHPEEVSAAFDQLEKQGKVQHFGVSNFTNTQFELLSRYCDQPLVTNQIEISLFKSEAMFDGTLDYLMTHNINPMAWSPLGGRENVMTLVENQEVQRIAAKYGVETGSLLLSWLLKHPSGIIPVIGTMNPERVRSSVESLTADLGREDWFELLEIVRGYSIP
ncbi:aldo/keto reductase family oxidoreductase [Fulvivirga kasyanovii]|uniref:Oxidoreductase n=1 Tax=Fulvivirga kasyanovii TaxID=396812 RepID=A0ABW9RKB6_9BACT|nr:aldo/keto reductase [Fulvivirga kasyanovii]MTI24411.1 oxidoreductase [Fulvivirga kasyanovii]